MSCHTLITANTVSDTTVHISINQPIITITITATLCIYIYISSDTAVGPDGYDCVQVREVGVLHAYIRSGLNPLLEL